MLMSKKFNYSLLVTALLCAVSTHSHADTVTAVDPQIINQPTQTLNLQNQALQNQKVIEKIEQKQEVEATAQAAQEATAAAGEITKQHSPGVTHIDANSTTDEIYDLLQKDPKAFEELLLRSISAQDATALKSLLPAYERYPAKDPSVIDWGNALIALKEGDTAKSVEMFRKINAALPNIRLLRLQMATALHQNRQINAAKSELEKLLREEMPDSERQMLSAYLDVMKQANKWSFSANGSFVKDDNLENAPPVGTKIGDESSNLTYTTPHEKGTGFNYTFGADKKWVYDNKLFTSFSTSLGGTYYWNNHKFNDLSANASVGVGYQNAQTEIEFSPTFAKTWYGGGVNAKDNTKLKPYTLSKGARLSASTWVNPNIMLQHSSQFTDLRYEESYKNNDGKLYSMMNGVLYAPNARQYYGLYWNLSKKDGVNQADSYRRSGVNLSWNNTWNAGVTTVATLGIANKKYNAPNFAGIQRDNAEYTAGLSLWKRDFSIFGLTPRLNINSSKTVSNYAFDQSGETNATVMFTKTF